MKKTGKNQSQKQDYLHKIVGEWREMGTEGFAKHISSKEHSEKVKTLFDIAMFSDEMNGANGDTSGKFTQTVFTTITETHPGTVEINIGQLYLFAQAVELAFEGHYSISELMYIMSHFMLASGAAKAIDSEFAGKFHKKGGQNE